MLIRHDASGKSYLYDMIDINKEKAIKASAFSARGHSAVYSPTVFFGKNSTDDGKSQVKFSMSAQTDEEYLELAKEYPYLSDLRKMADNAAVEKTSEAINQYITDIHSLTTEQLEDGVRKLGFLNSLAYKGYRRLSDTEFEHNRKVYRLKESGIYEFAKEWKKRGLDVSYDPRGAVVYFRNKNGVQISFWSSTIKVESTNTLKVDRIRKNKERCLKDENIQRRVQKRSNPAIG